MAGTGVKMPMLKLSQLVREVIAIEGPAWANITPKRCSSGNFSSVWAQQCSIMNTSSTPTANTRNGTTTRMGRNSRPIFVKGWFGYMLKNHPKKQAK